MATRSIRPTSRFYRLALYGRSGSGKTCILAALNSPRFPNPCGHDCSYVKFEYQAFLEKSRLHHGSEDLRKGISEGSEALERACGALALGQIPEATKLAERPVYHFRFVTPDKPPFIMEIIDYSGELIDPHVDEATLAQSLDDQLSAMDGLLILAETPHLRKENRKLNLDDEINKLLKAFASLNAKRKGKMGTYEIPLAFLMTKWDRIRKEEMSYEAPEKENRNLSLLFEKNKWLPHWRIVNTLKNVLSEGDFEKFPVSALGPCQLVSTGNGDSEERPRSFTRLKSFGLEDPFVWIANRKDEIDLRDFERSVSSYWSWLSTWPKKVLGLPARGRELCSRFNHSERSRADSAYWRSLLWWPLLTLLLFACISISIYLSFETAHDSETIRRLEARVTNQGAADFELKRAQVWYEDYGSSNLHLLSNLIILAKSEARHRVSVLGDRREKEAWAKIRASSSTDVQLIEINQYLKEFPYGSHADKARVLKKDIEGLVAAGEVGKKVRGLLDKGHYSQAAETIVQARTNIEQAKLKDIETFFRAHIQLLAKARIADLGRNAAWNNAYKLLGELAGIDPGLMWEDSVRELSAWREDVQTQHDRYLYEEVVKHKDEPRCKAYLDSAPKKTMESHVRNYLKYLQDVAGPVSMTIILARIDWIKCWSGDDNLVTVDLNGAEIIKTPNVRSENGQGTGEMKSQRVTARLQEDAKLYVKVFQKNLWQARWPPWEGDRTLDGRHTTNFASLNGKEIELSCRTGCSDEKARAVFRVEHDITERELPAQWSEHP